MAVPLASLDFRPEQGKAYRGDFVVTHGDAAGGAHPAARLLGQP